MLYLGIFLVLYGIAVYLITALRPTKIWQTGKIQGFIKILGEIGTRIFFFIFGGAALGFGIFLLIKHWPSA